LIVEADDKVASLVVLTNVGQKDYSLLDAQFLLLFVITSHQFSKISQNPISRASLPLQQLLEALNTSVPTVSFSAAYQKYLPSTPPRSKVSS
jgi:hypothetical protein